MLLPATAAAAGEVGDRYGHHIAHAAIAHRCEEGVELTVHFYTTSVGDVTSHDLDLAREIEALYQGADGAAHFGRA